MKFIMHSTLLTLLCFITGFASAQQPSPTPGKRDFRKDPITENEITGMVELRLSVSKIGFWSKSVNARIDLIGHPELNPLGSSGELFERMCLIPRIGDQGGFIVDLRNEKGELVPLAVKNRRQLQMYVADIKPGQNYVYRVINKGVFETLTLPLSQWFDLTNPGTYTVRVQYKVFEASTRWSGPATSNPVTFAVK